MIEWLKDKLGITGLELRNLELEQRVQSYKESNRHFQNRLDKLESLVRECSSVSSDIHMTHNKGGIVFVAGRYRNKDYVELFTVDDNTMPVLIDQLKHLEKDHTRGYYDAPFQCDMKLWLDRM